MQASRFAQLSGGKLCNISPETLISGFALDSREVAPGYLFIAIKGANVDGHDFASAAQKAGAIGVLAEKPVPGRHILVPNVVQALADFARNVRAEFNGLVVGVTGSAGKTTTKEFIAAALTPMGPVLKTKGNQNSEFSSPLLWADLEASTEAVVVEMAMRGFGQIAHLAEFAKPQVGVVTNIGYSHAEMVGDRDGIARAKGELLQALPADGLAVLWAEDPYLKKLKSMSNAPVRTFGFSDAADCRIDERYLIGVSGTPSGRGGIKGTLAGKEFQAKLPAMGKHICLDAAAAIAVAEYASVALDQAGIAIGHVELPPMRMEMIQLPNCRVLLDAYNASPGSTVAALETLDTISSVGKKIAVLGEMRELGRFAEQGHREVGAALARAEVDLAFLIGESTKWIREEATASGMKPEAFRDVADLTEVTEFLRGLDYFDTVLVKGSRALGLERVLDGLKEPVS